jgi:hypothetical protein
MKTPVPMSFASNTSTVIAGPVAAAGAASVASRDQRRSLDSISINRSSSNGSSPGRDLDDA